MDVQHISRPSLYRSVSMVQQDSGLFHRSTFENLTYGCTHIDEESVFEICKKIGLHDLIMRLPDQYYTRRSERGVSLSGGQRQRLAIARALLHPASLLIFDEATSQIAL